MTVAASAVLAWIAACNGERPAAESRDPPVDLAAIADDALVPAVLDACHRGLEGMDRVMVTVTLPDRTVVQVSAALPSRLRAKFADSTLHLAVTDRAVAATTDGATTDLDAAAAARLRALRALVDVATLGPLHRATGCRRLGARTFALAQPDGSTEQLELARDALLVASLSSNGHTVRVTDHLRTSRTRIVRAATVAPLGNCTLRIESTGVTWDPTVFEASANRATTAAPAPGTITVGAPQQPSTPTIEARRPARWLVLDDPGDWTARARLAQQHMLTLRAHGQVIAGFPGLLLEDECTRFVIAFRNGDGQAEWTPPGDVRTVPGGDSLVVFAATGDLDARIAAGKQLLLADLAARGLNPDGPVLAQPYLHLDEATPTVAELAAPVVRVSIAVR